MLLEIIYRHGYDGDRLIKVTDIYLDKTCKYKSHILKTTEDETLWATNFEFHGGDLIAHCPENF